MSGSYTKEQQARAAQKAEQAFAAEQHTRMAIDEAHDAMLAKTERLRELRVARGAVERGAAPKVKARGRRK
jgi:hypothetical protein